jgi:hypothetical protein
MARIAIFAAAGCLLAAAAHAQSPSNADVLRGVDHVLGRGDDAPTIDDILGDTLEKIRSVDGMSVRAAAGRLRETEAELRLYESLLQKVRAGLIVEVPRPARTPAPSADELAAARRTVEELSSQLDAAERDLVLRSETPPPEKPAEARATTMADALLDVVVQVPAVPEGRDARGARDPGNLSRALFLAGDFPGTLEALDQIPPEDMTPEQALRRARSLDQVGRLREAKAAYEAVVAADGEGPFGRQAAWMLKLTRTREQVAGAIQNVESRPRRETGEKAK